ncbi:MAG: BMP family protein [Deltaproteobacteria bacterium]|nr:BMP family protein [Deltaproteobacteria bacterium]MBW2049235.1 BMP family protein [Deltaproteobacteria bacterium]MBW2112132.1 BMP family protein [Deltaproteobacteria bacterium]MBW2354069.1 BMP family protein [Deltaproteobacteria bacterium]
MVKKIMLVSLICTMVVFLVGPAMAKEFKIAAIFQTAIEEPWDGAIHQACLKAAKQPGVKYEFAEKVGAADFEKVLREYSERGFDLIVGDAFLAGEDPARRVAKDYPKIAYAFGSEFAPVAPNFSVFDNWIHEPAYLCGVIAGRLTKTNILGVVAAIPIAEVNRLVNAFKAGALSVNPKVKVKVAFIGGWFNPPKAKEAALAQIEAGADIIFAERFGVFEAAKEKGVLAFGNMSDQNKLAPDVVITGPVWNMYPTIDFCIKMVKAGTWQSMDLREWSMMAKGGASLAPFHGFQKKLPKDLIKEVKGIEQKILSGKFRVPVDEKKPALN